MVWRNADFGTPLSFLMTPFHFEDFREERVIKRGRNYVAIGDWLGRKVVVKQFRKATWANHLIYSFFRKTKAERSYENARLLLSNGFDTPEPLAWSVRKSCGFYLDSVYVCSFISGDTLKEAMEKADAKRRAELIALYGKAMADMAQRGILLRDSNLGNFILQSDENGNERLALVDINRLLKGKAVTPLALLHAFGRSGFEGEEMEWLVAYYSLREGRSMSGVMSRYLCDCRRSSLIRRMKHSLKGCKMLQI